MDLTHDDLFQFSSKTGDMYHRSQKRKEYESVPISRVLAKFGIQSKAGQIVSVPLSKEITIEIEIENDDKHYRRIYGKGLDDEFKGDRDHAFTLFVYFCMYKSKSFQWEYTTWNELLNPKQGENYR